MPEELKYNVTVLDPATGHPRLFRKGEQYTDGTTGIPTWAATLMLNDDLWVDGTAPFDPPPDSSGAIAITDTFVVGSQAAMLALVAQTGDIAVRTDESATYVLQGDDPTAIGDWLELPSAAGAASIAELTDVDLTTYGLEDYFVLIHAAGVWYSSPLTLDLIKGAYQFDTNLSLLEGDVLAFDPTLGDDGKFAAVGKRVAADGVYDAATTDVLKSRTADQIFPRFTLNADGKMELGSGAAAGDVTLYRAEPGVLGVDTVGADGSQALFMGDANGAILYINRKNADGIVGISGDWPFRIKGPGGNKPSLILKNNNSGETVNILEIRNQDDVLLMAVTKAGVITNTDLDNRIAAAGGGALFLPASALSPGVGTPVLTTFDTFNTGWLLANGANAGVVGNFIAPSDSCTITAILANASGTGDGLATAFNMQIRRMDDGDLSGAAATWVAIGETYAGVPNGEVNHIEIAAAQALDEGKLYSFRFYRDTSDASSDSLHLLGFVIEPA